MTVRRALVQVSGVIRELPTGDTLAASAYDLAPIDSLLEAQCSANISFGSTSVTAIPGLTFSFTSPGTAAEWKIECSLDLETQNTNSALFLLTPAIDGTSLGKNFCVVNLPTPSRVPINGHWKMTGVAAGSHTLTLTGQCTGTTNGYDVIEFHSRLFLHRVK